MCGASTSNPATSYRYRLQTFVNHIETRRLQTAIFHGLQPWGRMSVITHLLIIASYGILSVGAGFVMSQSLPQLAPMMSYIIAGAGFLCAALMHEIFSRRLEQRDLENQLEIAFDEVDDLREVNRGLMADVVRSREEMAILCDVVEDAADGANQALVREMKVLQSQLGQFGDVQTPNSNRRGRRRDSNGAGTTEADAAATSNGTNGARRPAIPDSVSDAINEEEILGHIREALEENRVDLYIQPIVSLPQRRTRHFEVFSRIRTSQGRLVTPGQYIEIAKEQGLIGTIDNLLLMRCVQLLRRTENAKTTLISSSISRTIP